ncbi:MAG: hypothetical protein AAGC55_19280, partial [Myxococcota bacterium]
MSDTDRRNRRRAGDDTRQRIDDLADGWKLPASKSPNPPSKPTKPMRPSARRRRTDGPRSSQGRNMVAGELSAETSLPERTPRPVVSRPGPVSPGRPPPLPVRELNPILPARTPRPEFDRSRSPDAPVIVAQTRIRDDDSTELMTDLPAGLRAERGDATVLQTERAAPSSVGLPELDKLPRKRGLFGDIRYVFTVMHGVSAVRGELGEVRVQLDEERGRRDDQLLTMAGQAITDAALDSPVVRETRDRLAAIEEARCRMADALDAAEIDITARTRARNEAEQTVAGDLTALEARDARLAAELAPLEQRSARLERKVEELRGTLGALEEQLRRMQARVTAARGEATTMQAQLASLRAERDAVARDQPVITAERSKLAPQLARLRRERAQLRSQIDELRQKVSVAQAEADTAIAQLIGHRDRLQQDLLRAEQDRLATLRAMGEKLCLERPERLALKLRAVDHHDVIIATLERRALDLGDLVRGVDLSKLLRGLFMLIAAVALPFIAVWLLL